MASPQSAGIASSKPVRASRPPADAPTPTTGQFNARCSGEGVAAAAVWLPRAAETPGRSRADARSPHGSCTIPPHDDRSRAILHESVPHANHFLDPIWRCDVANRSAISGCASASGGGDAVASDPPRISPALWPTGGDATRVPGLLLVMGNASSSVRIGYSAYSTRSSIGVILGKSLRSAAIVARSYAFA